MLPVAINRYGNSRPRRQRHEEVLMMLFAGATNKEIAETMSYTEQAVTIIARSPAVVATLKDMRVRQFENMLEFRESQMEILYESKDLPRQILKSADPSITPRLKADVYFKLGDRLGFAPTTNVNVSRSETSNPEEIIALRRRLAGLGGSAEAVFSENCITPADEVSFDPSGGESLYAAMDEALLEAETVISE